MFANILKTLAVFGLASIASGTAQQRFSIPGQSVLPSRPPKPQPYDPAQFTPLGKLDLLPSDEFATLRHPAFPDYAVRIKQSASFCEPSAKSYTGYIDIGARHLFYYFFESRTSPDTDPVVFWTNGGPGCASSLGLFMELGPCRVNDTTSTVNNKYAWNDNANVFFVDQPIGVGFSYADYNETVGTTEEAAHDIAVFIAMFFDHFTDFQNRPFHMAGESYGGRYLPTFAASILEQNIELEKQGNIPINLTSVMIGNGCTDRRTMITAYYEVQCQNITVPPVMDIQTCVDIKRKLPYCQKSIKESCYDVKDPITCAAADKYCSELVEYPIYAKKINEYNLVEPCVGDLCYAIIDTIEDFLNQQSIRDDLGVNASAGEFKGCNDDVNTRFGDNLDAYYPTQFYIAGLLERGVRVLIYVGDYDWACNWVGNQQMTLELEWSGQEAFRAQPLKDWNVNGQPAGKTRSSGPFTFATIHQAGHMVPYDKPEQALALVNRWLKGEDL